MHRSALTPALHLANDDIHHAHLIAQDSEGVRRMLVPTPYSSSQDPTADLLHATLHRREGE